MDLIDVHEVTDKLDALIAQNSLRCRRNEQ
jgi:hypothetical protein